MNIIAIRQEERKHKIADIESAIRQAIKKGININKKNLLLEVMSSLNLSRRVAREYIEVANFNIDREKNTSNVEVNTE